MGSGDNEDKIPWLNDDEFLRKHQMPRDFFKELHNNIKDDPVFAHTLTGKGHPQRPARCQLMTMPKAFGSEGTVFFLPNLRYVFASGWGTILDNMQRVVAAACDQRIIF